MATEIGELVDKLPEIVQQHIGVLGFKVHDHQLPVPVVLPMRFLCESECFSSHWNFLAESLQVESPFLAGVDLKLAGAVGNSVLLLLDNFGVLDG